MSNRPKNPKVICKECKWQGRSSDLLEDRNPFQNWTPIFGCPNCNEINSTVIACDEEGCWEPQTCGTPIPPDGYRLTCRAHIPKTRKVTDA